MEKMEKINKVILHCSASDVVHDDDVEVIRLLHTSPKTHLTYWKNKKVSGRGFSDIGYHFVITKDGVVHTGRSVAYQGAHCYGQNHDSIGICMTGNTKFSLKQFNSLFALLEHLYDEYGLEEGDVYGHYFFDKNGKTCPNFRVNL